MHFQLKRRSGIYSYDSTQNGYHIKCPKEISLREGTRTLSWTFLASRLVEKVLRLGRTARSHYCMASPRKTEGRASRVIKPIVRPLLSLCFKAFPESRNLMRYRSTFGRFPNVIFPKTYNEKIQRRMLFDRNPRLTLFSDKFLVRDYVRSRLGDDRYLTKLYAVFAAAEEVRQLDLPRKFVMKPSHASGRIRLVHDSSSISFGELESLAREWLRLNYFDERQEWGYKNVKPRVIFEEFLEVDGNIPDDYKIYCYDGEPRFLLVVRDRFGKRSHNYYNIDGSLLPVLTKGFDRSSSAVNEKGNNNSDRKNALPNLEKMLDVARRLTAGVDFVRVDLYNLNERIVFGELTNYCAAGLSEFDPPEWDREFGRFWI